MNNNTCSVKILVIDDEESIRHSFADYLEDRGFEVLTAENGRIGLELIEREQPHIVLLDLRMPELDGLEVLKQGRGLAPDTPKIVISGANHINDVVGALRYGAWDYLVKPVKDLSILEHTVEKALEKVRLIQENRAYQEDLEELVQERTRDLEQANKHLSNINTRLQKSEKQYRTLFEKTNDAIFIVEKASGRYLDANKAAAKLTGHPIEELKGLTTRDVSKKGNDKQIEAITNPDETMDLGIVTYRRPDNIERIARLSTVPLDGKTIIAIARDITHDLEVEKQLRHSQKMEAIGTLAGGIAHDFNNILSGIFGFAELAKIEFDNPEKTGKYIDQIIKGSQRARELVQQILTFSRQTESKKSLLKFYLVVKEAIKFLRSSIPSTIKIRENIRSHKTVLADATQAHQVVLNLCTNAYHAMRDSGGTLTVELTNVEILPHSQFSNNIHMPGSYVKLEVRDTGLGMDEDTLAKIFDPYFTTKQPDEGSGLGLAVVDGIVKKHNGFINAFSKSGQGSTFQVFFPCAMDDNTSDTLHKKQMDLIKGTEKIMLVDDEIDILDTTQTILEKQGYRVTTFLDGMSAFKAFEKRPDFYDLVLTDMSMPNMAGDKLSAELIKLRPDIPILLCTGFSETMSEEKALSLGIKGFLLKPIMMKDLSQKIREVLDENKS
ncbi:MAG: response regulator [Pseudomonadota bacterium]